MKLLIVESPGKLKTLRKILGGDWVLEASVGHTTELAHDGYKKLGFDMEGGRVSTRYIPREARGKQVLAKLRAAAKTADQVYLAMDPDREGEAIAWHLVEQLRLKRFVRVSYTQITESAVKAAIANPRNLDLPLVHAQRARQCLDKLVGYEVSPLLWNSTGGKSAGRVQSATLHLICERERERLAFKPENYWTLQAEYQDGFTSLFEPKVEKKPGEEPEEKKVRSEAEANEIKATATANPHRVTNLENREEKRYPVPPLITSTLQQAASSRLKYSPQKTMKIAQELYEGVGGKGLITYMRTDAVTLSPEFVADARGWLKENAPQALAEYAPTFKVKAEAQGAHEAIRPTSAAMTPQKARGILNDEQFAIYRIIWERAIASQCKPARLSRGQIEIHAGHTRWVARGLTVLDPGYLLFWKNIEDEKELPNLQLGQTLPLKEIKVEAKKTQPPSRYSEAKLIQIMEKLGIGRPSTYASTVMTIRERGYVVLDNNVLAPTELGLGTDDVLMKAMPDLVDVSFTAQMESSLDRIAEGKMGWEAFLCDWNGSYLQAALIKARQFLSTYPVRKIAPPPGLEKGLGEGGGFKGKRKFTKGRGRKGAGGGATSGGDSGAAPRKAYARKASAGGSSGSRAKKAAGAPASASPIPSGPAPVCNHGHGPLENRISKKGAPYWKCKHGGCDSWAWPGKPVQGR